MTDTLSRTFQALADPTRRSILARLKEVGEASVAELAAPFDLTQRAISKHVGVLEEAGLVSRSRDAQRRPSRLRVEPLTEVDRWLEAYRGIWDERFAALGRELERDDIAEPRNRRNRRRSTIMSTTQADRGLAVEIEQEFAAASDRVFAYWTESEALARWFAPGDYTTVSADVDARPGGAWRLDFRSGDGSHAYTEHGAFLELDPPRRVRLTLTQVDGDATNPETVVTVDLDDIGTPDAPRTRMRFRQTGYDSATRRDQNAEGWRGCFAKLEGALG